MKQFIAGILVTLTVIVLVGGAFYLGTSRSQNTPSPAIDSPTATQASPQPQATPQAPTPSSSPQTSLTDTITAAIQSGNTAALEGLLVNPTQVRLEATECCGPLTPQEVITQLAYIDAGTNWDFTAANPIAAQLAIASPQFYGGDAIVGTSANKYTVSFIPNAQNQIEAISMTVNYELLLGP